MAQLNIPTVPIPAGALVCDPQAELVLSSQVMTPFPDTSLQPETKETQAKEETFVLQSKGIMAPHHSHFGRGKKVSPLHAAGKGILKSLWLFR